MIFDRIEIWTHFWPKTAAFKLLKNTIRFRKKRKFQFIFEYKRTGKNPKRIRKNINFRFCNSLNIYKTFYLKMFQTV